MTPVVDIVIKSYPPDFEYLKYCLRSIYRFASGFRRVMLMLPPDHGLQLTQESIYIKPGPESYLYQQVCKLNADLHTDAQFLLHLDSDCVLTQPVTPATFMENGKPRWLMTPWKDCLESKKCWFHVMAKCVQEAPTHEFMRRHGIMIPHWAYGGFREFIQATHGLSMDAYVMNQPGHEFSEFNTIGFWLWLHHRDAIHWHDTSVEGIPPCPIEQAWSWSAAGITQEYRNRMEMLLA